ncbi:hypothetical protein C8R44DRAFT_859570 [Mycena epipterygia]|nr:hypothetical protein C8R44DRAFT_859570 [Mycena epipterygia]
MRDGTSPCGAWNHVIRVQSSCVQRTVVPRTAGRSTGNCGNSVNTNLDGERFQLINMADYLYNLNGSGLSPAAAYIIGLGPLPPSTNRELAVAGMNAVLDSGMFDGTRHFEQEHYSDGGDENNMFARIAMCGWA